MASLLLVPMKCQHCYHKFNIFLPFAIGKKLNPPTLKAKSSLNGLGLSHAAKTYAETERLNDHSPERHRRDEAVQRT